MNRAARRAMRKETPPALRDAPIVSVTLEQWQDVFARRGFIPGDIVKIPGWRRRADGNGVEACKPGEETPLRVELRRPNERLRAVK